MTRMPSIFDMIPPASSALSILMKKTAASPSSIVKITMSAGCIYEYIIML